MSRNCEESLAQIYTYLDGELDAVAVKQIKEHLQDCPPCESAFAFEEKLKVVVRTHLQEEVPEVVIQRLRTVIRSEGIIAD